MESLSLVLAPCGHLYFSGPVGRERLEFNAHRIFSTVTILKIFDDLTLKSFSGVNDVGEFFENISPHKLDSERYSCGMFEFMK